MQEEITTRLKTVIEAIIPLYLDEAEVDEYPFASYDIVITPRHTKDGIYKLDADVRIYVIGYDYDVLSTTMEAIKAAIADSMSEGSVIAREGAESPKCYQGLWDIEKDYSITQIR